MSTVSLKFQQAASMVKTQGIISVVFGGLGILMGVILTAIFLLALAGTYNEAEMIEFTIYFFASVFFIILPNIYLLVAGIILLRQPEPKLAKILTIVNVVVGALSNLIVLVFAIVSLVQINDYEAGYKSIK